MDKNLNRKEATRLMGISYTSWSRWESNHQQPTIKLWPKVISFLGYYPEENDGSLRYKLIKYRRQNGIQIRDFASQLGIDCQPLIIIENDGNLKQISERALNLIQECI